MVPAISMKEIERHISNYSEDSKAIGILFAKPQTSLSKDAIIPELNYFNRRSGKYIDFFLPGYSNYEHHDFGDEILISTKDDVKTYYSDSYFCNFIEEMEGNSKWLYSGETDLLILNSNKYRIDFSNCLLVHLEKALKINAISSPRVFMENIIRLSRKTVDTNEIQRNQFTKSIAFASIETFMDTLPFNPSKILQRADIFKKCNFSK